MKRTTPEPYRDIDFSQAKRGPVVKPDPGKTKISIRLDNSVIDAFRARTGVPVVMNTSYNLRGEPIVNTPDEAIEDYLKTGMDALVLGPYVLEKQPSP